MLISYNPFLAAGMAVLSEAVAPFKEHKSLLLQALGTELVSILDNALLQAIGWFARKQKMTAYREVLEALEQAGGVEVSDPILPLLVSFSPVAGFQVSTQHPMPVVQGSTGYGEYSIDLRQGLGRSGRRTGWG